MKYRAMNDPAAGNRGEQMHALMREFSPAGFDERQYCSPGFDLPVGRLTRTPESEYAEYLR